MLCSSALPPHLPKQDPLKHLNPFKAVKIQTIAKAFEDQLFFSHGNRSAQLTTAVGVIHTASICTPAPI